MSLKADLVLPGKELNEADKFCYFGSYITLDRGSIGSDRLDPSVASAQQPLTYHTSSAHSSKKVDCTVWLRNMAVEKRLMKIVGV